MSWLDVITDCLKSITFFYTARPAYTVLLTPSRVTKVQGTSCSRFSSVKSDFEIRSGTRIFIKLEGETWESVFQNKIKYFIIIIFIISSSFPSTSVKIILWRVQLGIWKRAFTQQHISFYYPCSTADWSATMDFFTLGNTLSSSSELHSNLSCGWSWARSVCADSEDNTGSWPMNSLILNSFGSPMSQDL